MNIEPYIRIYKVNRGWYAEVGCQSIIFGNTVLEQEEAETHQED